jgi:hypothetical protein
VGRVAYGLEIEPRYVDVAITRWQQLTKLEATLESEGRTFEEIKEARASSKDPPEGHRSNPAVSQPRPQRAAHRGKTITHSGEGARNIQIAIGSEGDHG